MLDVRGSQELTSVILENLTMPISFNTSEHPKLISLEVSGTDIRELVIYEGLGELRVCEEQENEDDNDEGKGVTPTREYTKLRFIGRQTIDTLELYKTSMMEFVNFDIPTLTTLRLRENKYLDKFANNTFERLGILEISNSVVM